MALGSRMCVARGALYTRGGREREKAYIEVGNSNIICMYGRARDGIAQCAMVIYEK